MAFWLLAAALQDGPSARVYSAQETRSDAGYALRINARTRDFPDSARLTFDLQRVRAMLDWPTGVLEMGTEPVILSARAWAPVYRNQVDYTVPISALGAYHLTIEFRTQGNSAVQSVMRRDFRHYTFEEPIRIGTVRSMTAELEKSWRELDRDLTSWDAFFARLEELEADIPERARHLTRLEQNIGADVQALGIKRDRSLLPSSMGALAQLAIDFSGSIHVWISPPERTEGTIWTRSEFSMAREEITAGRGRAWIGQIPSFAVREHALLELTTMAGLMDSLRMTGESLEDLQPAEIGRRLKAIDADTQELDTMHAVVTESDRAELYAVSTVYHDPKKKIKITVESLMASLDRIAAAAEEAFTTDPENRLGAFLESLDAFDAELELLRSAVSKPGSAAPDGE